MTDSKALVTQADREALDEAIEAIDGLSDAVGRYFEVGPLSTVRRDLRQALARARTLTDKLKG